MSEGKAVLIIGIDPELIDFSGPEFAAVPGLSAAKVMAGLTGDQAHLRSVGYDAHLCLTDLGETAEAVVEARLKEQAFDCVVIGAGIRTVPRYFLLFERLINVVHAHAPRAKLCFNTKPSDTAEAVLRWV